MDGGFTAEFPQPPQRSEEVIETSLYVATKVKHITLVGGDEEPRIFMLAYEDFPEWFLERAAPEDLLRGAMNGSVKYGGGALDPRTEKAFRWHGYPALEFLVTKPVGHRTVYMRVALILVGARLFQLCFGDMEDDHDAERARFVRSFRLFPEDLIHPTRPRCDVVRGMGASGGRAWSSQFRAHRGCAFRRKKRAPPPPGRDDADFLPLAGLWRFGDARDPCPQRRAAGDRGRVAHTEEAD